MTVRAPGRGGRLDDRAHAGELLRPLIRGAVPAPPVIVGVGVGGLAVAAHARSPRSPLGALDVEEFDLPDALHPRPSSGAVSSTGHVLLRSPAVDRMATDPARVIKAVRQRQMRLGPNRVGPSRQSPIRLPARYAGPPVRNRQVVLVDDGCSSPSRLAAALDFIRRDGPLGVVLAVACAPAERTRELEAFAGPVLVALEPSWTEWFAWHGDIYESDALPDSAEIDRLLRV